MHNLMLQFHPEVADALKNNQPVVALESTIIAHGMPWPQNKETALKVGSVIRKHGAIPATIAVMDGKICVGLSEDQLDTLAQSKDVLKLSRRDLPIALAQNKLGATTVASTMIAAKLAGIPVFVTGGIGGVHRGVNQTWDISADLQELMQTSVAVVCAGAKSILDLPKTMEVLETGGVPVIGYKTAEFPAFFSRKSGLAVDMNAQSAKEIAKMMKLKWDLGLQGGVLIGNPVPIEHALEAEKMEKWTAQAISEADTLQISGKKITPFLLERIRQLSGGDSLKTNIQLVLNNAELGAKLAVAYAEERNLSWPQEH
jgi:pseudouridylate synthase